MIVYTIGRGGAPITPGPLIAVGPLSTMEGELIMIVEGEIVIELAPHVSVINVPAKTDCAASTFTAWFIAIVRESFIITVTERLCSIFSVWLLPTVRV